MFYDKLLDLCVERNISPSKAAESIGMTGAHVTRWKRGSVPIDTTVQKFANFFNVPVGYFYDEKTPTATMDDGLKDCLEILRERPDTRALVHAGRDMTPEQVGKIADFMRSMRGY